MGRVRGLDAIRAVCAFWVVMSHCGGPPITAGLDRANRVGHLVGGVCDNFWNGAAAVIVFFVVSGFCIHYPFARSLTIPSLAEYASRRYLRISIPLLAATVAAPWFGVEFSSFHKTILWSLAAELVYYSIYPGLLALRRQGVAWRWMVLVGFGAAFALAATNPTAKVFPSWGVQWDWIMGIPGWLLGCELAERTAQGRLPAAGSIGWWRAGVWAGSVGLSILRFHSPVGFPWTLNLFGLVVTAWLAREISRYTEREPARWLEWAGGWSYSLYLAHVPAFLLALRLPLPDLGPNLNWVVQMGLILGLSYGFSLVVEWPGHVVARSVGRALALKRVRPVGFATGTI